MSVCSSWKKEKKTQSYQSIRLDDPSDKMNHGKGGSPLKPCFRTSSTFLRAHFQPRGLNPTGAKTFSIVYIHRRPSSARSAPISLSDEATVVQGPSHRRSTGAPVHLILHSLLLLIHPIGSPKTPPLNRVLPTSWSRSPLSSHDVPGATHEEISPPCGIAHRPMQSPVMCSASITSHRDANPEPRPFSCPLSDLFLVFLVSY